MVAGELRCRLRLSRVPGSVATYTATDPEGDDLDWSLSGNDADSTSPLRPECSASRVRPNFEEPSDSDTDKVYDVTVEASDGTYADLVDVSVTVTDIQEVPITNPATQVGRYGDHRQRDHRQDPRRRGLGHLPHRAPEARTYHGPGGLRPGQLLCLAPSKVRAPTPTMATCVSA